MSEQNYMNEEDMTPSYVNDVFRQAQPVAQMLTMLSDQITQGKNHVGITALGLAFIALSVSTTNPAVDPKERRENFMRAIGSLYDWISAENDKMRAELN